MTTLTYEDSAAESTFKLMLVTHKNDIPLPSYLDFISLCVSKGVTAVQLREKKLPDNELFAFGKALKSLLKTLAIPLIINDNVKLAQALNADGVHLGQSDGSVLEARQCLGTDKYIGLSIESFAQIHHANLLPIDYVGIGTIFPTLNKADVATVWGCEGLAKISAHSHYPIIAIGGINENNLATVLQAGAYGIAAIGAFHDALDPQATTATLRRIIDRNDNDKNN